MNIYFVVITGFLIRIVLPLLLMAGLVTILRRLDSKWQTDAITQQKLASMYTTQHVLELKDCAISGVSNLILVQSNEPCWQVFRKNNGYLHDECLNCKVFRAVPVLLPNN